MKPLMMPEVRAGDANSVTANPSSGLQTVHPRVQHATREFVMTRDQYHIRCADHSAVLQQHIAALIERMYSTRGLQVYHPRLEQTAYQTTIVACKGDHLFATLTLGLDSPE